MDSCVGKSGTILLKWKKISLRLHLIPFRFILKSKKIRYKNPRDNNGLAVKKNSETTFSSRYFGYIWELEKKAIKIPPFVLLFFVTTKITILDYCAIL